MLLENKVAMITGASGGIGRATAIRFAKEGAKVVIVDVSEEGLSETLVAIQKNGGEAISQIVNVTDRDQVQNAIDVAVKKYGKLDILVNNAGITRDGITARIKDGEPKLMSDEKWDAVIEVNLKGTFICAQLAAIEMIKQGSGKIVNTSSVSALGNFGQANYAASKAGVIGLTKTLAIELARYHINVNCIAPGAVATQMTAEIPEKGKEMLMKEIPFGRMADPDEIASVHLFLCSDLSSYITGQAIFVDGGLKL